MLNQSIIVLLSVHWLLRILTNMKSPSKSRLHSARNLPKLVLRPASSQGFSVPNQGKRTLKIPNMEGIKLQTVEAVMVYKMD
jgi:hypothetical protein